MCSNPNDVRQIIGKNLKNGSSLLACLAIFLTQSACVRPATHDRLAQTDKPESVEQAAPNWVGEFARDVSAGAATVEPSVEPESVRRPHVVLISLDTLRADHLGAWGYDRNTSPFFDALARNGVRFKRAYSQSPKTAPSHMSLFTGTYPSTHGTHVAHGSTPPTIYPVAEGLETLPEIMHRAGYRTAA